MIKVANNELFNFQTEAGTNDYGNYFKTKVLSVINSAKSDLPSRVATITSPELDYNLCKTAIQTKTTEAGSVNLLLKAIPKNTYDSEVVLIGFPFNGLAAPIADSKQFRIHKGTIVVSKDVPVMVKGTAYKKILYIALEVNRNVFDKTSSYYTPTIEVPFTSYSLCTKQDKTTVTIKETMLVIITDGSNVIDIKWTSEEVPAVDKTSITSKKLFTRYEQFASKPAGKDIVIPDKFVGKHVKPAAQSSAAKKPSAKPYVKKPVPSTKIVK